MTARVCVSVFFKLQNCLGTCRVGWRKRACFPLSWRPEQHTQAKTGPDVQMKSTDYTYSTFTQSQQLHPIIMMRHYDIHFSSAAFSSLVPYFYLLLKQKIKGITRRSSSSDPKSYHGISKLQLLPVKLSAEPFKSQCFWS